ncbi:MAG: hypothetical protein QW478_12395 [Candidatus Micrarchaeaceae archaeon]
MATLYTYKITLSNTTSTATSPNLQVRLNINFASLVSNINADLGNIRFSSDQAGSSLLYAWLESAPQGTFTQSSSLSAYTSSNVWVNLGNNIIPANGSLTIYMQVLSSGTEFDGVYWGANPLWTSTYGQYDNGANVFNFYDNFAGTSLRSAWTNMGNATTTTVNNGVTMATGTGLANEGYYFSGYQIPLNSVIDALFKDTGSGNVRGSEIGIGTSIFGGSGVRVESFEVNPGSSDYWYMEGYVSGYATTPVYSSGTLIILSGAYYSTGATEYENYVPVLTLTGTATTSDTYPNFGVYQDNLFIQWLRVRVYPPNGTDPVLISIQILLLSNYTSASISSPEWTTLSGKPYVTVSAKGIANGLSSIPNDGADFGPDTLLGASSPNQYGPPYTQTSGIQEAWNYATANAYYIEVYDVYIFPCIYLLNGEFKIYTPITLGIGTLSASSNFAVSISGNGQNMSTINYYGPTTTSILTIDTNIDNITLKHFGMNNKSTGTVDYFISWNSAKGADSNILIIESIVLGGNAPSSYGMYMQNVFIAYIANLVSPVTHYFGGVTHSSFLWYFGGQWSTYLDLDGWAVAYATGITGANIYGGWQYKLEMNSYKTVNILGTCNEVDIYSPNEVNIEANIGILRLIGAGVYGPSGPLLENTSGTSATIGYLYIDGVYNLGGGVLIDNTNLTIEQVEVRGLANGMPNNLTESTVSGTTAGSVLQNAVIIQTHYKKVMFTFSGYENDTTTNQTINFLFPFSTIAGITTNTTGLTISASTSGITITSPNSTTTYSGIVIVEGY